MNSHILECRVCYLASMNRFGEFKLCELCETEMSYFSVKTEKVSTLRITHNRLVYDFQIEKEIKTGQFRISIGEGNYLGKTYESVKECKSAIDSWIKSGVTYLG